MYDFRYVCFLTIFFELITASLHTTDIPVRLS